MQRYFAKDKNLNISNNDKHHIINVMRMKEKDNIEIVYDKKVFLCEITNITKNDVTYKKIKEKEENNELDIKVTIAIPLVIEKKMDFILQKCTELGAHDFIIYEKTDQLKIRHTFMALIPVVLYATYYVTNILIHMENNHVSPDYDWYYFVQNGVIRLVIVLPLVIGVSYFIGFALLRLNKKGYVVYNEA